MIDGRVVRTARRVGERRVERTHSATTEGQEAELIATAKGGLSRAKPGNLPGKSHGRTEIVPVLLVNTGSRVRRAWSDKLQLRQRAASLRLHPGCKAAAGISEQVHAAPHWSCRQSIGNPWHAVVIPPHSEIQRHVRADLPVVLKRKRNFPVVDLAHSLRCCLVIGQFRVRGVGEPVQLSDLGQGAGEQR